MRTGSAPTNVGMPAHSVRVYVEGPVRFSPELLILAGHALVCEGRARPAGAVEYVDDLRVADVAVLQHKWAGTADPTYARLNQVCVRTRTLLLAFYDDDDDDAPVVGLGATTVLYRTNLCARHHDRHPRERPLASVVPDCFDGVLLPADAPLAVSFYGAVACAQRRRVLDALRRAPGVRTDFVHTDVDPAVRACPEVLARVRASLFVVCVRGTARLYEALMMGRIPLLVRTDGGQMHPAAERLARVCVCVDEAAIGTGRLVEALRAFYAAHRGALDAAQRACRALWLECYSERGILDDILESIGPSSRV